MNSNTICNPIQTWKEIRNCSNLGSNFKHLHNFIFTLIYTLFLLELFRAFPIKTKNAITIKQYLQYNKCSSSKIKVATIKTFLNCIVLILWILSRNICLRLQFNVQLKSSHCLFLSWTFLLLKYKNTDQGKFTAECLKLVKISSEWTCFCLAFLIYLPNT